MATDPNDYERDLDIPDTDPESMQREAYFAGMADKPPATG